MVTVVLADECERFGLADWAQLDQSITSVGWDQMRPSPSTPSISGGWVVPNTVSRTAWP